MMKRFALFFAFCFALVGQVSYTIEAGPLVPHNAGVAALGIIPDATSRVTNLNLFEIRPLIGQQPIVTAYSGVETVLTTSNRWEFSIITQPGVAYNPAKTSFAFNGAGRIAYYPVKSQPNFSVTAMFGGQGIGLGSDASGWNGEVLISARLALSGSPFGSLKRRRDAKRSAQKGKDRGHHQRHSDLVGLTALLEKD